MTQTNHEPNPLDLLVEMIAAALAPKLAAIMLAKQPSKMGSALLSVRAAAERLGMTEKQVRGMIDSGRIPRGVVRRSGRRIFLHPQELDRFINQGMAI